MRKFNFLLVAILLIGCGGGGGGGSSGSSDNNSAPSNPTPSDNNSAPSNPTPMDLVDNGDGTVSDRTFGLMWQQTVALPAYNWYEAAGVEDLILNPEGATDVCGDLVLSGYTDWRLPTEHELLTLVKFEAYNPAMDTDVFPNVIASRYWSSTIYNNSNVMTMGTTSGDLHTTDVSSTYFVRCVRGGELPSLYMADPGNGVIVETTTNLMWQKETGPALTIDAAETSCNNLSLAGYEDWRLPDIWELVTLIDFAYIAPTIDWTFFPNTHSTDNPPYYVTRTQTFGGNANEYSRWSVNFKYGSTHSGGSSTSLSYFRCVRSNI